MYGTRRCTIDAKTRLTLPADIRKSLGADTKRLVLVPFKNECLYGFSPEKFEEWVLYLFASNGREYDDRKPSDRKLMRKLRGGAVELTLDSADKSATVSFAKNAVSKELGENRFKQLVKKVGEEKAMAMLERAQS